MRNGCNVERFAVQASVVLLWIPTLSFLFRVYWVSDSFFKVLSTISLPVCRPFSLLSICVCVILWFSFSILFPFVAYHNIFLLSFFCLLFYVFPPLFCFPFLFIIIRLALPSSVYIILCFSSSTLLPFVYYNLPFLIFFCLCVVLCFSSSILFPILHYHNSSFFIFFCLLLYVFPPLLCFPLLFIIIYLFHRFVLLF